MFAVMSSKHTIGSIAIVAIAVLSFLSYQPYRPGSELATNNVTPLHSANLTSSVQDANFNDLGVTFGYNQSVYLSNLVGHLDLAHRQRIEQRWTKRQIVTLNFDAAVAKGRRTLQLVNGRCAQKSQWNSIQQLEDNGWSVLGPYESPLPDELIRPIRDRRIPTGTAGKMRISVFNGKDSLNDDGVQITVRQIQDCLPLSRRVRLAFIFCSCSIEL